MVAPVNSDWSIESSLVIWNQLFGECTRLRHSSSNLRGRIAFPSTDRPETAFIPKGPWSCFRMSIIEDMLRSDIGKLAFPGWHFQIAIRQGKNWRRGRKESNRKRTSRWLRFGCFSAGTSPARCQWSTPWNWPNLWVETGCTASVLSNWSYRAFWQQRNCKDPGVDRSID